MADIFNEVDEALKQEKAQKLWAAYGPTIILAAVLLVLSTAATTAYKSWDAGRDGEETTRLIEALEGESTLADLEIFSQNTRSGHKAVSLLTAAGLHTDKGEFAKGAALYKQLFEEGKGPSNLLELSRILYVRAILSSQEETKATPLLDVLTPVLAHDKSPWIWQARLDAALIEMHLQQNAEAALKHLAPFKDAENIPPSLADKATNLRQLYASQKESATE